MAEKTFLALKKNCAKDMTGRKKTRLAIIGDSATQHLATALRGYAYDEGYDLSVLDAPYDQIDAQIMDDGSELYAFHPDFVLLFLCTEKLYARFVKTSPERRCAFAQSEFLRIETLAARVRARAGAPVLMLSFVNFDDGVFGNYAWKEASSFPSQFMRLTALFVEACQKTPDLYPVDLNEIRARMGADAFRDEKLYAIARMPISLDALPDVAARVIDTVKAIQGRVKKCAILDLDNTLWGGVIGDDGMENIEIGELGAGRAFTQFQTWLKELKNRGVILAVCSKNEEETAKKPFLHHPDMILKLEDISVFVANWRDKAENIVKIRERLNIGFDSMVFFDDNPFERSLVRGMLPEVVVPELPEDPALYTEYARGLNLFETASYSAEDRTRTDKYREEAARAELAARFESYDDYLVQLKMRAVASPFDRFHYPRIAQLTQRSNQFNLRTVRYTEAEIEALAKDDARITRYFCLTDAIGDHGLVAVAVLDKQDADTLFISELLMSCRVLKRGMEQFIVNHIVKTAHDLGFSRVIGEYLPTAKNGMVASFYENMGFLSMGDGRFFIETERFTPLTNHIQEKETEHEKE